MTGEARELFARFVADGDVGASPSELPDACCATSFTRHDEDPARRGLPGACSSTTRAAQRTFIVAPGVDDTVDVGVADPRRRRARSTSPTTTSRPSRVRSRARATTIDALRILLAARRTGAPTRSSRAPRGAAASARALHRSEPERAFTATLPQGARRHHLDGQARRPRHRRRS